MFTFYLNVKFCNFGVKCLRDLKTIENWGLRKIEGILQGFLWKGTSLWPSGAKVAWASVCYPLKEGGLGIKRCKDWNKATILKHVWRLISNNASVWSSWVHRVLLGGRSFWHVKVNSRVSWAWRKILIWVEIGAEVLLSIVLVMGETLPFGLITGYCRVVYVMFFLFGSYQLLAFLGIPRCSTSSMMDYRHFNWVAWSFSRFGTLVVFIRAVGSLITLFGKDILLVSL